MLLVHNWVKRHVSGNARNLSKMADRRRRRALEDEGEEASTEKVNEVKSRPSECVSIFMCFSYLDSHLDLLCWLSKWFEENFANFQSNFRFWEPSHCYKARWCSKLLEVTNCSSLWSCLLTDRQKDMAIAVFVKTKHCCTNRILKYAADWQWLGP